MGAGPFGASLAAILAGQHQGEQATQVYHQRLEQQQLEDQINRALLMGKLQDFSESRAALANVSPEERQFLTLGGTAAEWQKRQDATSRAGARADQLFDMATKPGLTPEQQIGIYKLGVRLRNNPDAVGDVANELKELGVVTREAPDPRITQASSDFFNKMRALPPNATVNDAMGLAAAAALAGVPEAFIAEGMKLRGFGVESPSGKTMDTPLAALKGIDVVTPDGEPWPNPIDTLAGSLKAGGVPLSDKGKEVLALNKSADADLENLLTAGEAVLPGGKASKFAKGAAPYKIGAEAFFGVPNASSYNAAKIGLITHLRAVANASRVNQTELAQVNSALSNAHSYPALQAAVKQARDLLRKSRQYIVKAGRLDTSGAPANPSDTGLPAGFAPYSGPVIK